MFFLSHLFSLICFRSSVLEIEVLNLFLHTDFRNKKDIKFCGLDLNFLHELPCMRCNSFFFFKKKSEV